LPFAVLLLRCAFCLLVITCHSSVDAALAQGTTATLSGTVTDQNGAVIPDVSIAVINIAQGFQRSATTNGEGAFVVPLLPPGHYTVKAEHNGFTPTEVRDVVLNVNDQVAMKIHMNVGTVSQTVQIVEGSSLINESPAVATVVDRQFIENMPLNGRGFQSLISLTPGVVLTKAVGSEQGQFSVNGQRADANYFTVDGVSANVGVSPGFSLNQSGAGALPGLSASGSTNNLVSVDALQEFKVQTSTYAPEFGRTPGAQVQILTRAGTNRFHGTLFEYFRNDALDANDWFANANRLPKPALRQNDFGGVLGGPIFRNRTFFFFSYEGLRLRLPQTAITTVPSLNARQMAPVQLKAFVNAFPQPNGRVLTADLGEFNASFTNPSKLNATSIRADHTLGDKLIIFVRYNYAPSNTVSRGGNFSANTLNPVVIDTQTLTGGATWAISPNVSNEVRANWSKVRGASSFRIDNLGGAMAPPDSSLFPSPFSQQDAVYIFNFSGGTGGLQYDVGTNADNFQRQVNFVNNLSITTREHQLKFGIDYRRLSPTYGPRKYAQIVTVDNVTSALASFVFISTAVGGTLQFTNFSAYAQDSWKAARRLTFTYGLRWEFNPPPSEKNGNDPFAVVGIDSPASLTLASQGTPLYKTTYNNFAPRIGAAYQLLQSSGRETILRGGFGIFYDLGTGLVANVLGGFPYIFTKSLSNVDYPLSARQLAPPAINVNPPFGSVSSTDPNLQLPYTYQWNFTVEQTLGTNQTVSASYVAAVGRRLLRSERLASPNANFTTVNLTRNIATSDYHAMQLQFHRRLSRDLQALVSYAWSHSIDTASNDSAFFVPSQRFDPQQERGSSDFDVRHSFSGAVTYRIPAPPTNAIVKVLRNWSVDTIYRARSATPVNVVTGATVFGVPTTLRPDLIVGAPLYLDDSAVGGGKRINRAAFAIPPAGRQGTLGRNKLRGFPVSQVDLALHRQFYLTDRINLQFRTEFFNLFNHPNFGDPGRTSSGFTNALNNPQFGQSTVMLGPSLGSGGIQPGLNPLYQIGGPRSIQFALKLKF